MPNHSFKNMCKYKMANKHQLISNVQDKETFQITDLSKNDNISDEVVCIKQDCMVWFDKESLTFNYIEFNEPDNVRQFYVGSVVIMVDIIDNLIIGINVDHIIILFSRNKQHEKWHLRLVNEPEHENGEYFIINSCVLDNLVTLSFIELIHPQGEEEEEEEQEQQSEFKIVVWDLNLLIKALNAKDSNENKLYDIKIGNVIIPISFTPTIVHNCVVQKRNENTNTTENYYYILSSTADDGIITIFIFDDDLRIKETRNFMYSMEEDVLLWASVHADGTILAIGRKEIEIFNINDTELDQHRKIPANVFDSFNLYDIIFTPELLYIMMFSQPQEEEIEENGEVRLAILDISEDQENCEVNENKKISTICTKWSDKEVCFNKLVDTGIVTYNPETKHVMFTPFSKCFCKI
jgi:hypothetical protein